MKHLLAAFALLLSLNSVAQAYNDSLQKFRTNYIETHEVVKGHNREHMQFYEADKKFLVKATFKKATKKGWINFKTSGEITKLFQLYGTLSFRLAGKPQQLNIYQSQELMTSADYKNYLFLPFTDKTTGTDTYVGGRYIDVLTSDIKNNQLWLDFNKAYNPYCAYVSGIYNCPLPPKENNLAIAITAGEKNFATTH